MIKLSSHQTRLLRLRAQRLTASQPSQGSVTPAYVLHQIFGVQAQDLPAAQLAMWARSPGLTDSQVDDARQRGEIAWIWAMRGTLHLVDRTDALWLAPFLGPKNSPANQRRFRQLGWNEGAAEAGKRLLLDALAEQGGQTRAEIISLLKANSLPSEGQAPIHLIFQAAQDSLLCSGPDRDGTPTYVLFENWLGKPKPLSQPEALQRMATRYLESYAPAGIEDFSKWSGLKAGEARRAWELMDGKIGPVEIPGKIGWLLESQLSWLDDPLDEEPVVRLLPRFDIYLLGYADRSLAVAEPYNQRVHPGGGIIHPVLLVDGQAQGTWKTKRRKGTLEVIVEPFESLSSDIKQLLEDEVSSLGRFLGVETFLNIEAPIK
jgi:hypothetical protein